jgi:hypothetical protein
MKISASTYVEGAWNADSNGDHVALPLDDRMIPDELVSVMCREMFGPEWDTSGPSFRVATRAHMRAAIRLLAMALGTS